MQWTKEIQSSPRRWCALKLPRCWPWPTAWKAPCPRPLPAPLTWSCAAVDSNGRVVVTGMGKSGIIAQKIAATLSSTGSPALFLHPAEAVHGDLGVLMPGDVVIALSASGETEEILRLLPLLKRKGDALISFSCTLGSTLAQASDVALDCSVAREACGLNLAPTASTTAMLALGDALAIAVSLRKGFRAEDFADLHPGGKLGSSWPASATSCTPATRSPSSRSPRP
jgi:D-arabinose 5-phosphate isomerase GutQ